jgi:hypothetical protein
MSLVAAARTVFLKALAATSSRTLVSCAHDDDSKLTLVTGNVVHCACGFSIRIPCQHIRVTRHGANLYRCDDCAEWRSQSLELEVA